MLDVNAQFALPTITTAISNLADKQSDEILKSRFETVALLLKHIDNDKMWDAIAPLPKAEGTRQ